jgi:hypothetical protein
MAGDAEVTVRIPREALSFLDLWASARNATRTQVVREMLVQGIGRAREAFEEAERMLAIGADEEDVATFVHTLLEGSAPPAGDAAKGGATRS